MLGNTQAARDATALPGASLRGLATGFFGLTAATLGLIVVGALVRVHEAGLACPDWPLCFGEVVPEIDKKVGFEFGHRVYAGAVALCFAALGALAWRRSEGATPIRAFFCVGAALLVVQILLGALTVWLSLASWTVTAHLLTGNAFAATVLLFGCAVREQTQPVARAPVAGLARAAVQVAAILLVLQVALGGLVSSQYAGMACPEWPTCNGGEWFPSWGGSVGLHLLHRMNGYALFVALAAGAWLCRGEPRLRGLAAGAAALGICQLAVGIANVLLGIPIAVTGLHSALAALLVLTLALATRETVLSPRR